MENNLNAGLNFDVLENLNIPKIDQEVVITSKPAGNTSDEEEEEIEETNEVESLAAFTGTEEETEETVTSSTTNTDADPIEEIANWQAGLGIMDFNKEEYDKAEDKEDFFKQKFLDKVKKTADEGLHPVIRELNEKFRDGVPLDMLITSKSNETRLEGITDEILEADDTLQENLVAEMLRRNDWSEAEIKDEIETYKDANKLKVRAQSALKKLTEYEKSYQIQLVEEAKANKTAQEAQYTADMQKLKDTIYKAETFIEGVTLTDDDKEKLYHSVTKRDKDGYTVLEKRLLEKPELQFAFAQFVLQLDGKFDTIKANIKSDVSRKVKNTIEHNTESNKNKNTKIDISVARDALRKIKKTY